METTWTVCVMAGDAPQFVAVVADGFSLTPEGFVTFWKGTDTVACFAAWVFVQRVSENG